MSKLTGLTLATATERCKMLGRNGVRCSIVPTAGGKYRLELPPTKKVTKKTATKKVTKKTATKRPAKKKATKRPTKKKATKRRRPR